jgi:uncharacterized membrane protein YkgB
MQIAQLKFINCIKNRNAMNLSRLLKNDDVKIRLLTLTMGLMFLWFGALKFFPNMSPAEAIGSNTVCALTMGILPENLCLLALAILEVCIGIFFLTNRFLKTAIIVACCHLVLTFSPFILFPDETFNGTLVSLSLLGQYIIKNLVIISALLLIYPWRNEKYLSHS